MAQHPDVLLKRDIEKLKAWIADPTKPRPSVALGALGELIAAEALQGDIVSDDCNGHDVRCDGMNVEVKARFANKKWKISLGGKDATYVARVLYSRCQGEDGQFELWADTVDLRERGSSDGGTGRDPWKKVDGFARKCVSKDYLAFLNADEGSHEPVQ